MGLKQDAGKNRLDLLPVGPLLKVGEVYTIGSKKYDDRNWEKGIAWSRCYGAMLRHIFKWWSGESIDKQDGQHHLASVVFYAFALMEYEDTHAEMDDRPKKQATPSSEVAEHLKTNDKYMLNQSAAGRFIPNAEDMLYKNGVAPCGHAHCTAHARTLKGECAIARKYEQSEFAIQSARINGSSPDATGHS